MLCHNFMPIPDAISFAEVDASDRIRQTYNNIDLLCDDIDSMGLIYPLILARTATGFRLVDGGRRHAALTLLGTTTLYHARSCVRGQPGFLLQGDDENSTPLMALLSEIAANHHREDIPWQEELPAVVKAWHMVRAEHHLRGEEITMRAFGHMLGVGYQDLRSAVSIWATFQENPERFADCSSVRMALTRVMRDAADTAAKVHSAQSAHSAVLSVPVQVGPQPTVPAPVASGITVSAPPPAPDGELTQVIPLSQMFRNCNSLDAMESMPKGCVNHIICDPDYAVSAEALSANGMDADRGVAQASVEDSLVDLKRFLTLAFHVVDDYGFCAYFMDLDHWEKLSAFAASVGWRVQRWPAIWRKADFRSNAAPYQNFCKNIEYAMVLRKPGAVLAEVQTSTVFEWGGAGAVREFNHPFAKPTKVWRWFYQAITKRGQTVFDPFLGSGSSAAAAIEHGLAPLGMELSPDHFANAMVNIQLAYAKKLGPNTRFS